MIRIFSKFQKNYKVLININIKKSIITTNNKRSSCKNGELNSSTVFLIAFECTKFNKLFQSINAADCNITKMTIV